MITGRDMKDGEKAFNKRAEVGFKCIEIAAGGANEAGMHRDDLETAARDAVGDILTALFGAYAAYRETGDGNLSRLERVDGADAAEVNSFLSDALEAYMGDAEDYELEPTTKQGEDQ